MVQISKDRVTGMIIVTLGIIIVLASLQLQPSVVPDDIGPAVFPILAAALLILNGTRLIAANPAAKEEGKKKTFFSNEEWKRFFILLGGYILYFLLLWLTGFIPATLIIMFIMCKLFSEGKKVPVWKQILFAIIVTVLLYCAFLKGLRLRLPVGELIQIDL